MKKGNYGKIDNLHIYYTGNRITGVLEDADPVTTNGSMDYAGTTGRERAVEYNEWGAMTKDEARGITSITYDRLGNPSRVDFSSPNGSYASYVYSATGERLKAIHYTKLQSIGEIEAANYLTDVADNADNIDPPTPEIPDPIGSGNLQIAGMTKLEYHGPVIYRDGYVDMVRFPGGYATVKGSAVTFHYYTQDYLGNNRAVVNGSTGEIEQTVAYYPYGAVIADLGISSSYQPFKFGGKELTTQNGLNEYDFGARQYYPAVPGFTSVDPLCEKTPDLSPYLYCGNNPVNAIDADGKLIIFVNGFHFGDGGSSRYWNGIDKQIMNKIGDNNAVYYDGSVGGISNTLFSRMDDDQNLYVEHRMSAGYEAGYADFENILTSAGDESIKFVTHSMGSAYAKGMISGMMTHAKDEGIDLKDKISFEVDFAPFQPSEQTRQLDKTIVIQHLFDGVAGTDNIPHSKQYITHTTHNFNLFNTLSTLFREHSIDSFSDDIENLFDRVSSPEKS